MRSPEFIVISTQVTANVDIQLEPSRVGQKRKAKWRAKRKWIRR